MSNALAAFAEPSWTRRGPVQCSARRLLDEEVVIPTTYPAMLRHGKLEWLGEPPLQAAVSMELRVEVAVIDEIPTEPSRSARAIRFLEELAALGGPTEFGDPVEWQRETRRDRPLLGRDDFDPLAHGDSTGASSP